MDSTGGAGMFGTLIKRIDKGNSTWPLSLMTSAAHGSQTSRLPDAANDPVTAVNDWAQHGLQASRTAK